MGSLDILDLKSHFKETTLDVVAPDQAKHFWDLSLGKSTKIINYWGILNFSTIIKAQWDKPLWMEHYLPSIIF